MSLPLVQPNRKLTEIFALFISGNGQAGGRRFPRNIGLEAGVVKFRMHGHNTCRAFQRGAKHLQLGFIFNIVNINILNFLQ